MMKIVIANLVGSKILQLKSVKNVILNALFVIPQQTIVVLVMILLKDNLIAPVPVYLGSGMMETKHVKTVIICALLVIMELPV